MMNRKGQAFFLLFMLAVTIFIIAFALAPSINSSVDAGRTTADCGNASIDTSQKVTCTTLDLQKPYIFFSLLGIAGAILTGVLIR